MMDAVGGPSPPLPLVGCDGSCCGVQEKEGVVTKARSILEFARLQNRANAELWVEAVRMELRNENEKLATSLLAKALQVCVALWP
jgi:hypothetical protein